MTKEPPTEPAPAPPPERTTPPSTHRPGAMPVVVPTPVYWGVLLLSLFLLFAAFGLYNPDDELLVPLVPTALRWATAALAFVLVVWSTIGLLRRGRLLHRSVTGTRRLMTGVAEGLRERSDRNEGALERLGARWAARFNRLGKAIGWLILLPWRIAFWTWYNLEATAWHVVNVAYDVIYYPLYAAWLTTLWTVRTALRVAAFLLRVAWKLVRFPTRLPYLRTVWAESLRPPILERWHHAVAQYRTAAAKRIERGRRLAAARGENPDRWEADHRLRRAFPLPHPEKGRIRIRKRIAHIRDIQRARREGRPLPTPGISMLRLRRPEASEPGAGSPAAPSSAAAAGEEEPVQDAADQEEGRPGRRKSASPAGAGAGHKRTFVKRTTDASSSEA